MSVDGILSRLNPLIAALLRSPLSRLFSSGLLLLTVTGRRSGRRYSIPVGYQRDGDDLVVIVSEARSKQWWRNYYEPGPVSVRLGGAERAGRAALVAPGSDEFQASSTSSTRRARACGPISSTSSASRSRSCGSASIADCRVHDPS